MAVTRDSDMDDIVVSVVVPTYNRPRALAECLTALRGQTFSEPWEVIVVDDGSPIPAHVDGFADGDGAWCRVIRQANAGPGAGRNHGVREARGQFVAFTDDDCLPEPAWLETLVRATCEQRGALVGGTTVNGLVDQTFAATSQLILDLVYEHYNADPDDAYFFTSNNFLCPRDGFLAIGGFDERFRNASEDREFCDRWRIAGRPLVWSVGARVEHRHTQGLWEFLRLHYRYGRGAHRYQAARAARRSGEMREDIAFHATIPGRVWRRLGRGLLKDAGLVAALCVWQAANAIGFFTEMIATRMGCTARPDAGLDS